MECEATVKAVKVLAIGGGTKLLEGDSEGQVLDCVMFHVLQRISIGK